MSEIHCLSHPLHSIHAAAGQAERIHRHACRVRRVACERIGAERLHAYCERVKEAFEAYVQCGWGAGAARGGVLSKENVDDVEGLDGLDGVDMGDEEMSDESLDDDERDGGGDATLNRSVHTENQVAETAGRGEEQEVRGRSKERGVGSAEAREISNSPMSTAKPSQSIISPTAILAKKALGKGIGDSPHEVDVDVDEDIEADIDVEPPMLGSEGDIMDDEDLPNGDLMKIDLDDVAEEEEE